MGELRDAIWAILNFEEATNQRYPFRKHFGQITDDEMYEIMDACNGSDDTETIYNAIKRVIGDNPHPVTLDELREALFNGKTLDEMLAFGPGQDCEIFKANGFAAGDIVIYVPDTDLNEIDIQKRFDDPKEIDDVIGYCYTGQDFIDECGGDLEKAKELFELVDWQHPSSAHDDLMPDEEELEPEPEKKAEREFFVDTPMGRLKVWAKHKKDCADDYPGVYIDLVRPGESDVMLACVEYDSSNKELQADVFGILENEQPTNIIVFGDQYRDKTDL